MLKIAITNQKGGVGKTTSTLNIGAAMARKGLRVLMVDMDGQQNLTRIYGLRESEQNVMTFLERSDLSFPGVEVANNLYLMPGSPYMHGFDETARKIAVDTPGLVLKYRMEQFDLADNFDVILFDCPPKLDQNTLNVLVYCEWVFVPVHPDSFSMDGLQATTELVESLRKRSNPQLKLGGIFLIKYNARTILHRQMREALVNGYGDKVLEYFTRESISINEAITTGSDVFSYDLSKEKPTLSNGSKDYEALTNEILFVTGEKYDVKRDVLLVQQEAN